jgi:hypothetical protein
MKKLDLGQTVSILGNLGVIAGIIFLGFELRQNRDLARAQMANALTLETQEIARSDINGPMADILVRNRNGDPLNEADQLRFGIWQGTWNSHIENIFFQYQEGLYPQEALDRTLTSTLRTVTGFRDRICRSSTMSPDLSSYLQAMTGEPCQ